MKLSSDAALKSPWTTSLRAESRQVCKGYKRVLSAVNLGNTLTERFGQDYTVLSKRRG